MGSECAPALQMLRSPAGSLIKAPSALPVSAQLLSRLIADIAQHPLP